MITKILNNSNNKWLDITEPPCGEVILLFADGFIARGIYNFQEEYWYYYDSFMNLQKSCDHPKFYISL